MKVRDKTKNHTVNQKQAKNKTWIRHKKKFKMNINKQEPETGKILIAKRFVKKKKDVIDLFTVPSAILDMQPRTRENEAGVDLR